MNEEVHFEFDHDNKTGLYAVILTQNARKLHIEMEADKFQSICSTMLCLIKDVNLLQAKQYEARLLENTEKEDEYRLFLDSPVD